MQVMTKQTEARGTTDVEQVALEATVLAKVTAAEESPIPSRILIVPAGEVRSTSGTFLVDDQAMLATVAAFNDHGTDLPIDYEHQTLGGPYSSPSGQAPAAGWIKSLIQITSSSEESDMDGNPMSQGLWAKVAWTQEARQKLSSRQYRYISPVALIRRSDRRLVGLHSVALTNKPAIVGMRPVVNRDQTAGIDRLSAVDIKQEHGVTLASLREVLALDETADDAEVLMAGVRKIEAAEAMEAERHASDRVSAAMSAGKLTAPQSDWALALARRDPEEFDRWEAAAPRVVPLGRTVPPNGELATPRPGRKAIEVAAREEWRRSQDLLETLCTEEAYVANALRENGE